MEAKAQKKIWREKEKKETRATGSGSGAESLSILSAGLCPGPASCQRGWAQETNRSSWEAVWWESGGAGEASQGPG